MSRTSRRARIAGPIDRLGRRTWLLGLIVVTIGGAITVAAAVSTNGVPVPPGYTFVVQVPRDAPPLKVAAPVRIAGKRAGSVVALRPERDDLLAEVEVDERYAPVGRDARVVVRSAVGTSLTYLVVQPGDARDPIPAGGTLPPRQVEFVSSLPQALETFDAEVRAALQTNLTVPAAGLRGRGEKINRSLGNVRRSVEDGAELAQAAASRPPGTVRESLRNAGTVYGALAGSRPDDLGATISAVARVTAATSRRRTDVARGLRGSAALQAAAPPVLDDLDRTTASATVLFEQAAPLLRSLGAQSGDVQAILEAGPQLSRDVSSLLDLARPALQSFRRSSVVLRRSVVGIEPLLGALADFSAGASPYGAEIETLAVRLLEAGTHKGLDGYVLRVSPGLGCHTSQNPRPAPGKVSEDRRAC
jgi:ABC-type transporter Mla subunit MlaD